tara:strand:+ start:108 stop:287 length:180 start_codon:yes stop_codon:yes gene_type:complete
MENVINFYATDKIICSAQDWINMDREEKTKKECEKRKNNPPKPTKLQLKLNKLVTLMEE